MLEIRELVKTYHTKGEDVRAIDGVSLTFDETGLVFLLGKSGSGKSTLLNLCGGLDEPDSGEIVIDGKSSSRFTASDFDSYRNTFVGFVFQEFNLLDEFTVGDNVALALELQGKDKKRTGRSSTRSSRKLTSRDTPSASRERFRAGKNSALRSQGRLSKIRASSLRTSRPVPWMPRRESKSWKR